MELIEFGTIASIKKGKKPKVQNDKKLEGYLPYVDIEAFETGNVKSYTDGDKCLPCNDGDILIVCDGSRSGFVGRAINGYVGSTLAIVTAQGMSDNYLYYFLQGKYALLNTKKKGTGTPHLDQQILFKQKLVVPTLDEQARIVAKIEELFSELDNSIENLKKIKQQLVVYRQAVLADAFSGRFTNSKIQNVIMLSSLIEKPRYGTSKKCNYTKNADSVEVYRIPNIDHKRGLIDHSDVKYATFADGELKELALSKDDILIIRSNGSVSLVGRAAIVRNEDINGTFAGYLMRLRIQDVTFFDPQYLLYYLQSTQARIYIENKAKSTSGVHNINSSEISGLEIPFYDYSEQVKIVKSIETRLSHCDAIEKTVNTILQQAEALRQSILKKAFEGEL